MEKLQAALETARRSRIAADASPGSDPAAGPKRRSRPAGAESLDALWRGLAPFELDDDLLEVNRVVTRAANAAGAPFDILRTKVLLQMRQNGWKRLAITSPMPRSGKTTMACNLALALGRQQDMRTMVLDLDLRDPSIHRLLRAEPQAGIGDVLTGRVDFADQAMRIGENVAFSMARAAEPDPARLLLAEETVQVLSDIEARYRPDVMIFDLPSVLVNDDTRAFLKNADCALIVARANTTRYGQFDTCEREITEQTNVLGVVLNAYRQAGRGDI